MSSAFGSFVRTWRNRVKHKTARRHYDNRRGLMNSGNHSSDGRAAVPIRPPARVTFDYRLGRHYNNRRALVNSGRRRKHWIGIPVGPGRTDDSQQPATSEQQDRQTVRQSTTRVLVPTNEIHRTHGLDTSAPSAIDKTSNERTGSQRGRSRGGPCQRYQIPGSTTYPKAGLQDRNPLTRVSTPKTTT